MNQCKIMFEDRRALDELTVFSFRIRWRIFTMLRETDRYIGLVEYNSTGLSARVYRGNISSKEISISFRAVLGFHTI